jgi:hypothetical protein
VNGSIGCQFLESRPRRGEATNAHMIGGNNGDHCIGFGDGCRSRSRTAPIDVRTFVEAKARIHNGHVNGFSCQSKNSLKSRGPHMGPAVGRIDSSQDAKLARQGSRRASEPSEIERPLIGSSAGSNESTGFVQHPQM